MTWKRPWTREEVSRSYWRTASCFLSFRMILMIIIFPCVLYPWYFDDGHHTWEVRNAVLPYFLPPPDLASLCGQHLLLWETHVRYHRFLPWWWYTIYSIDFKTTYTRIPTPQWDVNHIDYQHNYQNNCGRTRKWNRMACLTLLLLAVLRLACVLSSR